MSLNLETARKEDDGIAERPFDGHDKASEIEAANIVAAQHKSLMEKNAKTRDKNENEAEKNK